MDQRPVKVSMISLGVMAGSVLKKYSSRWVPVRSCTNTQRTGTAPSPARDQSPVPLTTSTVREPPPYHETRSRVGAERLTTASGEASFRPFSGGRPPLGERRFGGGP